MDVLDNILNIGIVSGVCILGLLLMWVGVSYVRGRWRSEQGKVEPIKLQETRLEEKRQYPRAELKWPVTMEIPLGSVKAETKNISVGGAFLCCENPLVTRQVFALSIEIPDHEPLDVTGEVVWNNANVPDDKVVTRGMGIRFIQISAEGRHLIKSAVENYLEKDEKNEKTE